MVSLFVRASFLTLLVLATVPACALSEVDLEGRSCPCADGWTCQAGVCVRGASQDASTDARSVDANLDAPARDVLRFDVPPGVCGATGQPCCDGATCNGVLVCDAGTCVPCGRMDDPCCLGDACATGFSCDTSVGRCLQCGAPGAPCCPGTPCPGGGECVDALCVACGTELGTCVPGTRETEDCGNCGSRDRICNEGCGFGPWGPCTGAGECEADTTDARSCGNCGTQSRRCNESCRWELFGSCTGEGECAPGATGACDTCTSRTCSSSCTWSDCNVCTCDAITKCTAGCPAGYHWSAVSCTAGCNATTSCSMSPYNTITCAPNCSDSYRTCFNRCPETHYHSRWECTGVCGSDCPSGANSTTCTLAEAATVTNCGNWPCPDGYTNTGQVCDSSCGIPCSPTTASTCTRL